MMRFIVDCLRPTRTRAAAAQRDSVELQASDTCDTEIKELEDAVQREEKTLQMVKTLRCETQEDVERLEDMKSQLREKLKMMEHLEEQERKVLQSLQEEQQELEQTIQQYDVKLRAVSDSVLQLQMEVACAKAHAENMHVRIAPLQDSFEDILQVKKKLDELISGFVTDEPTVQEPSENPEEPTCGKLDVLKDNYDCYHKEEIGSEHEAKEVDDVELERSVDEPDQTQCSADNLKSSGSSSFTEITLTEVKEEHVMFRSTTSHLDSSDMEEEDFEIVQSSRDTDRQFDFFNPNPFIDGDVFGDDHFPKADVTERLPSDPFKGTDPFASDTLFVDILDGKSCQENFNTKEKSLPETVHSPLQSTSKDRDYGTFNSPVNLPLDAHARRPNERLYPSLSMPTESKCVKSRSNTCPEVETITTIDQTLDAVQVNQSLEAASPPLNEDCVLSHSSSEFDSFEGHCSTISAVEEEDTIPPGSLCGLQKIIAGSYTDFPLSPCYPHPDSDMTFGCQYMITHETNDDSCHSELPNDKMDLNNAESNDKKSDTPNHFSTLNAYDYKYGDMYFFTVRLDPGSPELHNHSPVCLESDDVKKCGSQNQLPWKENSLSPEFNDTDEFKYCNPKPKDTIQHCMIDNYKKGSDKVENEMVTDSVSCGNPHIPHFTNDDPNACESLLNSDAYDPAIHILDLSVQDTECVLPLKSSVQDLYSADQFCTYENLKSSHSPQSDSHCSERLAVSKSELQYFDPFSPISTESADCLSESEEIYTINCHDASRLDSGYHEADTPTALHQETNDTSRYSFALQDPCRETRKESNCEFTDPFSLKSFDTKIYDSEIENYESDYVMSNCQSFSPQPDYIDLSNSDEKAFSLFNTVQCNVLSDHHCGSEPNDCYTFGPLQHRKEGYTNDSNEENYMPELVRDNMPVCGETKPSPLASNACLHYGWKTSEPHPENHSVFMCSKSAVDSPVSKMDKQADNATNHTVDVTLPDLADIDYFCSELSKMVSSHSSDSVQQSVTEMLFGSDPNTSSFYPWDFEKQQYHS